VLLLSFSFSLSVFPSVMVARRVMQAPTLPLLLPPYVVTRSVMAWHGCRGGTRGVACGVARSRHAISTTFPVQFQVWSPGWPEQKAWPDRPMSSKKPPVEEHVGCILCSRSEVPILLVLFIFGVQDGMDPVVHASTTTSSPSAGISRATSGGDNH
jgi:hypothetical protein